MAAYTSSVFAATSLATAMSGTFIGCSMTLSYMSIPSLLLPAATSSKEARAPLLDNANRSWQLLYNIGSRAGPLAGLVGSVAYVYAWRALPATSTTEKRLLLAAAVTNMLVGPFTMIFMTRTNNELHRRANAAKSGQDEIEGRKDANSGSIESYGSVDLLQRWAKFNAFRSVFPALAVALTAYAFSR